MYCDFPQIVNVLCGWKNKENKQQLRKMNKLLLMQLQMKRCVRKYALRLTAFRETKSKSQLIKKGNKRKFSFRNICDHKSLNNTVYINTENIFLFHIAILLLTL